MRAMAAGGGRTREKGRRRAIIVLGMHRSGTSALAGALGALGLALPKRLMPSNEKSNPKGHFEPNEIVAIHDRLLAAAGTHWSGIEPVSEEWLRGSAAAAFVDDLAAAVAEDYGDAPAFVLKDPRLCRLVPLWRQVLARVGAEPRFALIVRNPLEVARSLVARDGLPLAHGCLMWLRHVLDAERETRGSPRLFLHYPDLLADPAGTATRVARALAGAAFVAAEDAPARVAAFVDPALRHQLAAVEELKQPVAFYPWIADAYEALTSLMGDPNDAAAQQRLDAVREPFDRAVASFVPLIKVRDGEIARLRHAAIEHEQALAAEKQRAVSLDEALAALQQTAATLERQLAAREEAQATELAKIHSELDSATKRIDELVRTLAEQETLVATLREDIGRRDLQIHQILSSRSWRLTRPLRFGARVIRREWPAVIAGLRPKIQSWGRSIYRQLPFPRSWKISTAGLVFRLGGPLFEDFPPAVSLKERYSQGAPPNEGEQSADTSGALDVYVPLLNDRPLIHKPARVICFYLPQFHPIPENDAWWGPGFTEWTNVQPARPFFVGHRQPRIPGELGYYNLLDKNIQKRQIELAKLYGIEGFCFYFYWFAGKRLLDAPLEAYLNDRSLDFPFCLCWANENWTRRWDGLDKEILIAQNHSADDDLAFIQHIARFMRDPRYIRVGGKPLLLVYRPDLLPSAKETALRWRKWCRQNGIGEIVLAYTQSFVVVSPDQYGFDAAVEFPPNLISATDLTKNVELLDPTFQGTIYDWRTHLHRSENYVNPGYKLYRSVCPGWDNTARRKNKATIFINNTPTLYQKWLENAIRYTQQAFPDPDERLIFVNAWNEWAEGAYLEPDLHNGYAYLQATRNALAGSSQIVPTERRRIIIVTHDAYPHGAQFLALHLARTFHVELGFQVDCVCLGDGPLKKEFQKWATLHDLAGYDPRGVEAKALAKALYATGHRAAFVNSTVSGLFLETLAEQGIECLALIHELSGIMNRFNLGRHAAAIARHAKAVVCPTHDVQEAFRNLVGANGCSVFIRPQGLYKRQQVALERQKAREDLRNALGLPANAEIILGVGYADFRKGADLFVDAGVRMASERPNAYWLWVGHREIELQHMIEKKLRCVPHIKNRIVFVGLQENTDLYYQGADIFVLTSREDPFPSVVLEAMNAGLPVVAFEGSSGCVDLVREVGGRLVTKEDSVALSAAVSELLDCPEERRRISGRARRLVAERFSFRHYIFDLLDYLGIGLERISVVVPNYNYGRYLPERLASIIHQSYPLFEIIFLDDNSNDGSLDVAREILQSQPIDYRIVTNDENTGSPFKQWKKGVELARGAFVWIAEADDVCDPNFIDTVLKGFRTPGVVFSYYDSRQIDENGYPLAENYQYYVRDVDERHWLSPFVADGDKEAAFSFSIKNVVPNVSAVLFRADALRSVLTQHWEQISRFRIAGDWMVYALLLKRGRMAFSPRVANVHRRHQGVTLSAIDARHLNEIRSMQEYVARNFPVPEDRRQLARAYLDEVAKRLGLQLESTG